MKVHTFGKNGTFRDRVFEVVRNIPKGKTLSYREVAARAGSPNAARAVGNIMKGNWDPAIPCHRVIRSDGKIGDYNRGGMERKMERLREEGASVPHPTSRVRHP